MAQENIQFSATPKDSKQNEDERQSFRNSYKGQDVEQKPTKSRAKSHKSKREQQAKSIINQLDASRVKKIEQMEEQEIQKVNPKKLILTDRASLRLHIYNLSNINNSIRSQIALKVQPYRSKQHHTPYLYVKDLLQEKKNTLSLDLAMLKDTEHMILNLFELAFEISPQTGNQYRINTYAVSEWINILLTQSHYGIDKVGNVYLNHLLQVSEIEAETFLKDMILKYLYLVNEKLALINFQITLQGIPSMLFHQVQTPFTEQPSKYNSSVYGINRIPVLPYKAYSVTMMSKIYQDIINIVNQYSKRNEFEFYTLKDYYDKKLELLQIARTSYGNSKAFTEYSSYYIYNFYTQRQKLREALNYFSNVQQYDRIALEQRNQQGQQNQQATRSF